MSFWLLVSAINGFVAVAAGAFGAHALGNRIPETDLSAFETGVQYHLVHTLALGLIALTSAHSNLPQTAVNTAGWAFLTGIVLFSGSLYFLGVTGSRALVLITPIGGVAFLVGWAALAWAAIGSTQT